MKNRPVFLINEYLNKKQLYRELGGVVYSLLKTLIVNDVHTHQITYRIKTRESLSNKIVRKNYKYSSLEEVTDIVGFRVILFFEDDVSEVERIIRQEFLVDEINSVDKMSLDTDKFGYRSLHFVVSMNNVRLQLPEYEKFRSIRFEIQVRSILQHSWAEIEHDIGYKGESEIPNSAKRTFYRIAALLEQADLEFVKLKSELKEHESYVNQQIQDNHENLYIDKASLKAFILNSAVLKELETEIAQLLCPREEYFYPPIIDNLLPKLNYMGILTIQHLKNYLSTYSVQIMDWVMASREDELSHYQSFFQGSSIIWLLRILEDEGERQGNQKMNSISG